MSVFDGLLQSSWRSPCRGCPRATVGVAGLDGSHQLVAVVNALVLDVMVLGTMIARIGDLGFTSNRSAALGLDRVLLVNLARLFLRRRSTLHLLEHSQTT